MPKTRKQTRGEIIVSLQEKDLISQQDLDDALASAGIESERAIAAYMEKLEAEYLTRVGGGWKLNKEARQTGVITIKVTPAKNAGLVLRTLNQVLPAFGKTVVVEMDA